MIPTRINPKVLRMAVPNNTAYADRIAAAYNRSAMNDDVIFGESLMRENLHKAVAVVPRPLTAALCTMKFLQPFKGAEVPVWVAVQKWTEDVLKAFNGRDAYIYPTAGDYLKVRDFIFEPQHRIMLGDKVWIDDGLFLANNIAPSIFKSDTDLASIVTLPFETSSLYMGLDMLEFLINAGANLLNTGQKQ